jgi:hypothetical protein
MVEVAAGSWNHETLLADPGNPSNQGVLEKSLVTLSA